MKRRALLALLLLLSGAAALCYEVAWTRHLVLVFGNTTRAVALLLGAYMLGLALGSEVGGRLADRARRPALLYAVFEAAIAVFAFAFPWLVDGVRALYLTLGTSASPVLFVLAFLLLVVPTFCMGTTLPLLARATVDDPRETARDVGFLYAANVVGAVIGAAATGLVLMEEVGVLGVTWKVAAPVNLAVGVVGFLAFRGTAGERPRAETRAPAAPSIAAPPATDRLRRAALVSAFASGFVGLAAQVAWTRHLTFFLNGFTWTFTAILTTFLTGLALGGAFFGRRASRSRDPARLLVRLHLGVAVSSALVLWALGHGHAGTRWAWEGAGAVADGLFERHRVMLLLASGTVLLVPSFLMGGCFPVATALFQRGLDDLGSRVGRVYAVNTAGCVLGSLVAGFVWQPLVGPAWSGALVTIAALVLAAAVAATAGVRAFVAVPLAAGAAALALVAADPSTPVLLRSHVFAGAAARETELVAEEHGQVCTVSVVENTRERFSLLYTDEFQAAGTKPEYRYMRMLAHLPVALARDPSRTLVICFGTGTTAGSTAIHSAVKELDLVEISPEVLAAADRFRDANKDVLRGAGRDDLDLRVHVDDGRHFVLRSDARWGVISLEPLMPYTPAAIHFYTREFYAMCRERLAPGGLMCQWIPLQGMSGDHDVDDGPGRGTRRVTGDFRRLVAAFVDVFPDSALFFVDGAVALVGGPDGVELSWTRVADRLADPRVAEDLREVGFADPARALATFVTGGERLRKFVERVEPVTDEHPVLEFHPMPPGVAVPWLAQNLEHMVALHAAWDRVPADLTGAPDADAALQTLLLATRSVARSLEAQRDVTLSDYLFRRRGDPQAQRDALTLRADARQALAQALAVDPGNETARRHLDHLEREWETIQGGAAIDGEDYALAERHLRRATALRGLRQDDLAWTRLAEARNCAKRHDAALEAAIEATRLYPGGLEPRAERAYARSALGDHEGAAADYLLALRGAPVTTLPERLRSDAARVLVAFPAPRPVADVAADLPEKLPRPLALRIFALDAPAAFRARFATELSPPAADVDEKEGLRRIQWLRDAAPPEAGDRLVAWFLLGRPEWTGAVAGALAQVDPARAEQVLGVVLAQQGGDAAVVAALVAAAGRTSDRRFVPSLLRVLRHPDDALRRAARDALFAILGEAAPGLARLDPAQPDYEARVRALEQWWARQPRD